MQNRFRVIPVLAAVLITTWIGVPLTAQRGAPATAPARPARTADGHPNLSGIWQAMSTAHWDLEDHSPSPASCTRWAPSARLPADKVLSKVERFPISPKRWPERN